MVLKIRYLVIMSLLIMLFSGVVHGEPLQEGVTIDGIYYGKGYDPESPNLLIGGILQKSPNPNDNPDLKKLADDNQAIYIPTYYDPNLANIKRTVLAVSDAALGKYSDFNGLNQLNNLKGEYNTVIAYSGGTATAITALEKQIVTCDTLILISPMAAGVPDAESKIDAIFTTDIMRYTGTGIGSQLMRENERSKIIEDTKSVAKKNFEDQINKILSNGDSAAVKNIIVIQSKEDKLPEGDAFQYRFPEANDPNAPSWINEIEVNDIILGNVQNGHEAIFKTYAMNNIKDGACTDLGLPLPSTKSVVADTPRFEETTPVAADVNSIGTPQSDVKFIKTSNPTSKILSNLNLEQGTTQTASQSTNAKSASVASSPSSSVQQAIDNMEPGEYNHYESTIPIPIGPAADALKAQGKYEEYLENALQAAEDRTAQDSQDGDAWYTKGLALHYLNRDEEANVALAQAKELGIQFESNGESFTRVGQAEPTTQATETTKSTDESNTWESTAIPTLYPITSPPPDESVDGVPVAEDVLSVDIPQSAEEWNSRGIALLNQGNYKEAQKAFRESIRFDNNPVAWKNYWDIYYNHDGEDLKASQSSETIPIAADVVSRGTIQEVQQPKPTATTVQEKSGVVVIDSQYGMEYFSSNERTEWAKRVELAKRAERDEEGHQLAARLAAALYDQGKYDEAIQLYKLVRGWGKYLFIDIDQYAPMCIGIGDVLSQQGKYDKAIQMYKKVFDYVYPEESKWFGSAWKCIGDALNKLNRTDEANAAFAKAYELEHPQESDDPQSRWQEEENMVRSSSPRRSPPNVWPQAEKQLEGQMGEYNHYESTNPVYAQARQVDGKWVYDA